MFNNSGRCSSVRYSGLQLPPGRIQCVKCKVVSHVAVALKTPDVCNIVGNISSSDAFTLVKYMRILRVSGPYRAYL